MLGPNGSTMVGTNIAGTFMLETGSLVTAPETSKSSLDHHVVTAKMRLKTHEVSKGTDCCHWTGKQLVSQLEKWMLL